MFSAGGCEEKCKTAPRKPARGGKTIFLKSGDPTPRAKKRPCPNLIISGKPIPKAGRDCRLAARSFRADYSFKAELFRCLFPL